jgi:hypothetical protein
VIVLLIGFGALIVYLIFGFVKSAETYKHAVLKAEIHSAVVEALGQPIEEGLFVTGNINISGSSGESDLAIPISDAKGKTTMYAVGYKVSRQMDLLNAGGIIAHKRLLNILKKGIWDLKPSLIFMPHLSKTF